MNDKIRFLKRFVVLSFALVAFPIVAVGKAYLLSWEYNGPENEMVRFLIFETVTENHIQIGDTTDNMFQFEVGDDGIEHTYFIVALNPRGAVASKPVTLPAKPPLQPTNPKLQPVFRITGQFTIEHD